MLCRRQVLMDFCKALLNNLTYLMDDSLDRIADVQAINALKNDAARWDKLSAQERQTNESFRASQVRFVCMDCHFVHTCQMLAWLPSVHELQ
jgi:hypothetical protein